MLQSAYIPLIGHEDCSAMMFETANSIENFTLGSNEVNQDQICSGLKEGGKDGCQGDSGGPLVVINENGKILE